MNANQLAKYYGVTNSTIRRWTESGKLEFRTAPSGRKCYLLKEEEERTTEKESICYCRVSSPGQKSDLERQIQFMQERYPEHRIISDIGSGLNYKRKGLKTLVELAEERRIEEIVITYRDRLSRFSFEFFEWFFSKHGVRLVVLDKEMDSSGEAELCKDIISIITVFSSRIHGKEKV